MAKRKMPKSILMVDSGLFVARNVPMTIPRIEPIFMTMTIPLWTSPCSLYFRAEVSDTATLLMSDMATARCIGTRRSSVSTGMRIVAPPMPSKAPNMPDTMPVQNIIRMLIQKSICHRSRHVCHALTAYAREAL